MTTPTNETVLPRKRRWRRILLFTLLVLVLLFAAYRYTLRGMIEVKLDTIRKQGYPVTYSDLDALEKQTAPVENAMDVLTTAYTFYRPKRDPSNSITIPADPKEAAKALEPYLSRPPQKYDSLLLIGYQNSPSAHEPLPASTKQLMSEYLEENAEALKLLHRAARMEHRYLPRASSRNLEEATVSTQYLNSLRNGFRLLRLEAMWAAENGQAQAAVDAVITSMRLAQFISDEPNIVFQMIGISGRDICQYNLQWVMGKTTMSDSQLLALETAFALSEDLTAVKRALLADRCFGIWRLQKPFEYLESISNGKPRFRAKCLWCVFSVLGIWDLSLDRYLAGMSDYVAALESPGVEGAKKLRERGLQNEKISKQCCVRPELPGSHLGQKELHQFAMARVTRTALEIERYRLKTGRLPDQIDDLVPSHVPAAPADPFDGKPLRYKKLAKGYIVYSVGEDGIDNGGDPDRNEGKIFVRGADITFTIER